MTDTVERVQELVNDDTQLESTIRTLLDVQRESGSWNFDDTDIDSGLFGELVSEPFVKEAANGYQFTDTTTVIAGLEGKTASNADRQVNLRERLPTFSAVSVGALVGALLVFVLARSVFSFGAVFRGDVIVLSGNDPYMYRYWVEQLLMSDRSAFVLSYLNDLPNQPIVGVENHDTLYIVTTWWLAAALGGGQHAAGLALAVFPVAIGVATALTVYRCVVETTRDQRVGIAAVLLFAIIPAHAFRSGVGFGDHHAFDYFWLSVTVLGLILARDRSRTRYLGATLVATSIAAQVFAWRGGPILVVPVAVYVFIQTGLDVRGGVSPIHRNAGVAAGIGGAAAVSALIHTIFNWAPTFRAFTPSLLALGTASVLVFAEVGWRSDYSYRSVLIGETLLGGLAAVGAFAAVPAFGQALQQAGRYFGRTGTSGIAETYSLISGSTGGIFGPVLLFGFTLFLGLPYAALATRNALRHNDAPWLVIGLYFWYFLFLAFVQSRFAGQLSVFTAVVGGVGLVHLAEVVGILDDSSVLERLGDGRERAYDLRRVSVPDRQSIVMLSVLFLLVGSLGIVQTGVKHQQVTIDDSTFETASWVADHADTTDESYPQTYVFSQWGRNRVYNYLTSGESRRYAFARANYVDFISATNDSELQPVFDRMQTHGVGYVVVSGDASGVPEQSVYATLADRFGSRPGELRAVERLRAVYSSEAGDETVFEVVDGARVIGTGPPNTTIRLTNDVSVGDRSFSYERVVRTNRYGEYGVTVPYAGSYDARETSIQITKSAVTSGGYTSSYQSHWTFDEGRGETTADALTDATGEVQGATWVDGVRGSALSFDREDDRVVIDDPHHEPIENGSFTISLWVKGNLTATEGSFSHPLTYTSDADSVGYLAIIAQEGTSRVGVKLVGRNRNVVRNFGIDRVEFHDWTQISVSVDNGKNEIRIYRDERLVQTKSISDIDAVLPRGELVLGGARTGKVINGSLDDVRIHTEALDAKELKNRSGINRSTNDRRTSSQTPDSFAVSTVVDGASES